MWICGNEKKWKLNVEMTMGECDNYVAMAKFAGTQKSKQRLII